jgi:hypothetical protein
MIIFHVRNANICKTSQGYIFLILQQFATKLCNCTHFKMLFPAMVMGFRSSCLDQNFVYSWNHPLWHCACHHPLWHCVSLCGRGVITAIRSCLIITLRVRIRPVLPVWFYQTQQAFSPCNNTAPCNMHRDNSWIKLI